MSLSVILTILMPIITAVLVWVLSRKKSTAETRRLDAETNNLNTKNVSEIMTTWKGIADDLREQVEVLTQEVSELRMEVHSLREENALLKKTMDTKLK